ncbi:MULTISPECIES: ATP-binding protein [Bordetella]|uniref:Serine/threonine protein kinase n=1 Tax=Bordetella genomosp. 6 TaxID=463024 RepID=A0ABX4FB07_9BORD|nr:MULTISPECIES: ATP-binding protein [Bordetella]AOB26178.1 serine/threonine protein kinase [Bordetella bronchiseptica]ARP77533.1 serine/threonine protein kinase [Bordetella genomosp. 6]AZW43467.1 ATP-binding protein [Bordetella bronchiseptica]KCV63150.1 histidine kinase-like ATPase domain protein [Bordetella bronchiseptica 99-R-0433]OZI75382.1 serine/threonine protein kinase [Bordetella genomosp. 6]
MTSRTDTLELSVTATTATDALYWLEHIARRDGWSAHLRFTLTLCADEALNNIMSHASTPGYPTAIHLALRQTGQEVRLHIADNGAACDPTQASSPPLARSLDDAQPGGHGLRLMRHFMHAISYQRRDGWNHLTLTSHSAPES